MRVAGAIAGILLVLGLAGCSLRGGGKSAKAAPPPPKPAPTASATAPEGPLSVPQTQVQLPPLQPVNPAAMAAPQEPQEPQPEPAPQAKPPRRPAPVAAAPKPVETPPAAAPQPAIGERPRLQEIVSPEERKKLGDQMAARKKEIDDALRQAAARPLSDHDRNIVDRIKSFLQLSDQAGARGELRQAEALSERALILARELRLVR